MTKTATMIVVGTLLLAGCATQSKMAADSGRAMVAVSPGVDAMIVRMNGERVWPAKMQLEIEPGEYKIPLHFCQKGNLLNCTLSKDYEFVAEPGKRYELGPSQAIWVSDLRESSTKANRTLYTKPLNQLSNNVQSAQQPQGNPTEDIKVYGLLEKNGDSFIFSKFALGDIPSTTDPWVNLANDIPAWDTKKIRCGIGLIKDRQTNNVPHCDKVINPALFMYAYLDKGDAAVRVIAAPLFLGLTMTGASYDVIFDQAEFKSAVANARKNSLPNDLGSINSSINGAFTELKKILSKTRSLVASRKPIDSEFPTVNGVSNKYSDLASFIESFIPLYEAKSNEIYQKRLSEYKSQFENANTLNKWDAFISECSKFDPSDLAGKAKENRDKLAKQIEIEIAKKEQERQKMEAMQAAARKKDELMLAATIRAFRKTLKSGDYSNCGLVIETKGQVIHIQSMIGPTWIKLNDVYPQGMASCTFRNGVYVPPTGMPI